MEVEIGMEMDSEVKMIVDVLFYIKKMGAVLMCLISVKNMVVVLMFL